MREIEQTLSSVEVAEMVGKQHKDLMRDIKRYTKQMWNAIEECGGERNFAPTDFFRESTYRTVQNKELPCYRITQKGCEFIAHKLTGTKGTIFTARYINRFHEMEDILKGQHDSEQTWFIRDFNGKKIMLFRDFRLITGVELRRIYTAWERPGRLIEGYDWNGWEAKGKCPNEEFRAKYGFDYGDEDCIWYLEFRGIRKAIRLVENDLKDRKKLTAEAKKIILDAIESIELEENLSTSILKTNKVENNPIQITLILNQNGLETKVY